MVDVSEEMRGLAEYPPQPPTPVGQIAARGRRRRHRRIAVRSTALAGMLALVVGGAVIARPGSSETPSRVIAPRTATASNGGATVTVDPGRDLADGQIVVVTGRGFPISTQLSLAQCEPGTTLSTAVSSCDVSTIGSATTRSDGTFVTRFRVRAPSLPGEAARRCETVSFCALGVAPASLQDGPIVLVKLRFAPPGTHTAPPDQLGTLTIKPSGKLTDRTRLTVTGTGLVPESHITLVLCDGRTEQASCGGLGADDVPVGSDGTFTRSLSVYRQLFTGDGFVDCGDPTRTCYLRGVLSAAMLSIDTPLTFDPDEPPPPLPTFTIEATGVTPTGLRVSVVGAHFPSDEQLGVSECALGADGTADRGTCITPTEASTSADADGAFTITAPYARKYATPASGTIDCGAQTCVLAWFRYEGDERPIAMTPLPFSSSPHG